MKKLMEMLFLINVVLFGLVAGSFLGLAVVRIPAGESVVAPRSHCRYCARFLSWYENIPVLSFIFCLGKCRTCKNKISWVYPCIEMVTAGITVFAFLKLQPWPRFLMYELLFILPLLLLLFLDLKAMILPDAITLPGIICGFVVHWADAYYFLPARSFENLLRLNHPFIESLLGALLGFFTLLSLAWLYQKWKNVLV